MEAIFALGDINDDGAIDLEEFIGVMYPSASTIANRLRLTRIILLYNQGMTVGLLISSC